LWALRSVVIGIIAVHGFKTLKVQESDELPFFKLTSPPPQSSGVGFENVIFSLIKMSTRHQPYQQHFHQQFIAGVFAAGEGFCFENGGYSGI
jgi:hypothetical protein